MNLKEERAGIAFPFCEHGCRAALDLSTCVLVRRAQEGNKEALEFLFSRYLPRVKRIVSLKMGYDLRNLFENDDIVQDAMLQAFRSLPSYRGGSNAGFLSWISRCVENRIVDAIRKQTARKRCPHVNSRAVSVKLGSLSGIPDMKQMRPSQICQAKELRGKIDEAFASLSEHFREVLTLRLLCGMSYREIAQELGFASEGSARSVVSRALLRFRRLLKSLSVEV